MIRSLRYATLVGTLCLAASAARAAEAGYVDFGKFTPADRGEFVEVNLHAPLLKFASVFVDKENPEVANLVRNLKHVRVNVVGYDEKTRSDTAQRVKTIRQDLEAQGWTQVVTVQEPDKEQDVGVYVKMNADDSIDGVVVTVLDSNEKQAVFVNVVGNIKPEQLAALGQQLHIEPLARFHLRTGKHKGV